MVTILASAIVILTEFGSRIVSVQAQVNASSLTPEQKDAICNPNSPTSKLNPVNTTESRICGIPVTVKPHPSNATAASSPNIATGGEAPPSTSSPSPSPPSHSPPPSTSIAPEAAPPSE
ncbi:MAG TPA: hypothetical protein VJ729_01545 [Nitrososphaeraceae archaeon]|nr:hypothetical protein [Nitrososphaeraceae archaeon]